MPVLHANPALLSPVAGTALREVREAHRSGRLGFLVGAGLSVPIGLPGWTAFNEALLQQALDRHAPTGAGAPSRALGRAYLELLQGQSLAAVDLVRQRVGADFHVVLRGALYEREQLRKFMPTEVHYALVKLALEGDPPFPCIHTTNYDDLLELATLHVSGRAARAVHAGERQWSDGPRVVHLHGYFPFEAPPTAVERRLAAELVASDLDYHRLANEHTAWTNRELLQLLDARAVLILGMSLSDPNVRRLLAHLSEHRRTRESERDHYVILQRPVASSEVGQRAAEMLEDDENRFWQEQGVKILRVPSWDALNYLLRRIRFDDDEWDRHHRRLRVAWANERYGDLDFDDEAAQAVATEMLAHQRDRIVERVGLAGRVEINLFLPMRDGRYRRALSSQKGRAAEAPRWFEPRHDQLVIPEVEASLLVGSAFRRTRRPSRRAPRGEPPFQDWYRSLVSVPYFDYRAGGIPVAVMQLVTDDERLGDDAFEEVAVEQLRAYMRAAITETCELLQTMAKGRILAEG